MLGIWGPGGTRVVAAETQWNKVIAWNAKRANDLKAWITGGGFGSGKPFPEKPKVFCASFGDVFEDWNRQMSAGSGRPAWFDNVTFDVDPQTCPESLPVMMNTVRARLFWTIEQTPNLHWQLLTKRPENIARMVPTAWMEDGFPRNVWMGVSVENQATANRRIPVLLTIPAPVLWVSQEPQLELINYKPEWLAGPCCPACEDAIRCPETNAVECSRCDGAGHVPGPCLGWIVCGGESGDRSRPFDLSWARTTLKECREHDTRFFFKQTGRRFMERQTLAVSGGHLTLGEMVDLGFKNKGDVPEAWPSDLNVREFPAWIDLIASVPNAKT